MYKTQTGTTLTMYVPRYFDRNEYMCIIKHEKTDKSFQTVRRMAPCQVTWATPDNLMKNTQHTKRVYLALLYQEI